jgi:hypothetical protein
MTDTYQDGATQTTDQQPANVTLVADRSPGYEDTAGDNAQNAVEEQQARDRANANAGIVYAGQDQGQAPATYQQPPGQYQARWSQVPVTGRSP